MGRVLVTGAGRGIGAAIVARLAGAGWDVYGGVATSDEARSGLRSG